jgi:hypothetical protein
LFRKKEYNSARQPHHAMNQCCCTILLLLLTSPHFICSQESFAKDVIDQVDSTKLTSKDGTPTLYAYRKDTIHKLIHGRLLTVPNQDQTQPFQPPREEEMAQRIQDVLDLSTQMSSSSGRTALDKNHKTLQEGTRITAMWKGGEAWYKGHVDYVHEDGSVDIQYDDGDYEWYVQTEAFVKSEPSKKTGRSKTLVHKDANVLQGGTHTHELYDTVRNSVTRHLRHVPGDGTVQYTRENEVQEAHFGGSDTALPSSTSFFVAWTKDDATLLKSMEDEDLNVRSNIEANMKNGFVSLAPVEVKAVVARATHVYEQGLDHRLPYVQRRAHVSYSRMHGLLWASNSNDLYLKEWDVHVPPLSGRGACSALNTEGGAVGGAGDGSDHHCHRVLQTQHLTKAAELGSPEAQQQLGVAFLQPSPTVVPGGAASGVNAFGGGLNTVPVAVGSHAKGMFGGGSAGSAGSAGVLGVL